MKHQDLRLFRGRHWLLQKCSVFLRSPSCTSPFRPERPSHRDAGMAAATAAGRGTPGDKDGASGKRLSRQHDAGGGDVQPGQPIILKPSELPGSSKQGSTGPLRRKSYRRTKEKAEESRRQRAEYRAQLAAAIKRARVSYIDSSSSPAPDALRVVLVDGYNVVHACPELHRLADFSLQDARFALNRMAVAYAATYGIRVYVVYDAMGSNANGNTLERLSSGAVAVFSAESEADTYIGKAAEKLKRRGAQQVMIVSNDRYVQSNAIDQDYIIYPVQLDTWLDQAHRAVTSGSGSGSGRPGGAAAAAAGPRPALGIFSPGSASVSTVDEDNEDDGEVQGAGGAAKGVLPGSWELHEELVKLANSDEEDDEEQAREGTEEEGAVVDYLAGVQDYGFEGWDEEDALAQEEAVLGDVRRGFDDLKMPHPSGTRTSSSSGSSHGSNSSSSSSSSNHGCSGSGFNTSADANGVVATEGYVKANEPGGNESPESSRDPWVGTGQWRGQGQWGDAAADASLPIQVAPISSSDSSFLGAAGSAPAASTADAAATGARSAAAVTAAVSSAAGKSNSLNITSASVVPQPSLPQSQGAEASKAAAAAPSPSAVPPPSTPTPTPNPPASVASAPKPGLSGLLGKGGRARLAGLVKQATEDLAPEP